MNNESFDRLSYRQKISEFKKLALHSAEMDYNLKVREIKFIHYGENTTFKITDVSEHNYLVRICRHDYHSDQALNEELKWLAKLSRSGQIQVPVPLNNKRNQLFSKVTVSPYFDQTNIVLFKWLEGRFIDKNFNLRHADMLGTLIAQLHTSTKKYSMRFRRYWDAEGLLGCKAKLGDLNSLELTARQKNKIFLLRDKVFRKLEKYQQQHPQKMGLIHADLHSGNFLFNSNGIIPIDFDDCGYGFYAYDLCIPFMVLDRMKHLPISKRKKLKKQILFSYRKICDFTVLDEKMIKVCIYARMLTLLTWLNARSSIPRIKKYYKVHLGKVMRLKHKSKSIVFIFSVSI